ncbi:MAG: alkaline phosphatase family protein [Anaerolineae bacterium]|nr:alkaline phosphatase family protein [Anaerolineae bacterium]
MNTIILGLDAFDPQIFENLSAQGKLPALTKFAEQHSYSRFAVSAPPQSEVSWTSIATGLDPAGHGMFDFVHRNPVNYSMFVSLLPTRQTRLGTEFARPHESHTLFDEAIQLGYPATSLWWPATFPARLDSPVQQIPGLGTPDIHGRLGVGVGYYYGEAPQQADAKIPVENLEKKAGDSFSGNLAGPAQKKGDSTQSADSEFEITFEDAGRARLKLGKQTLDLSVGLWSPILEVKFKMGLFVSVHAITRVIITQGLPEPRLYFLPLQIHPLHPMWRYATPRGFVRDAWNASGGYLSLGWPQDTTALEENWLNDAQFLALCEDIFETRQRVFRHHLDNYREGVLGVVFDSLDRVQHMLRAQRPDLIEAWYQRCDHVAGEVIAQIEQLPGKPQLVVVSDHGFANFDTKIHVNRWLEEKGHLTVKPGASKSLENVDWAKTDVYAVGLNSLYLNLKGREGQGRVPAEQIGDTLEKLQRDLLAWKTPSGQSVFNRVQRSSELHSGPYAELAPDLILGFNRGFRASAETGLGKWKSISLEENHDHWRADHCIDSELVPGVIFSNQGFKGVSQPSYRDFPQIAIGMTPKANAAPPKRELNTEEQADLEERLKGLGYL